MFPDAGVESQSLEQPQRAQAGSAVAGVHHHGIRVAEWKTCTCSGKNCKAMEGRLTFSLDHFQSTNMGEVWFMFYTAASHQESIKTFDFTLGESLSHPSLCTVQRKLLLFLETCQQHGLETSGMKRLFCLVVRFSLKLWPGPTGLCLADLDFHPS